MLKLRGAGLRSRMIGRVGSLVVMLAFLAGTSLPAGAVSNLPTGQPPEPEIPQPLLQPAPALAGEGLWSAPESWEGGTLAAGAPLPAASAPDGYGYTWDDAIPFAWVDATGGTDTGLSGSSGGQSLGPVGLGFTFPYYENQYSQVHIAASGYLAFTAATTWPNQSQVPASGEPNNLVAPYWAPMFLSTSGPAGRVYYQRGGVAPNRYFVVEWFDVPGGDPTDTTGRDDLFRFEVILRENGDILFQYDQMTYTGGRWCGAAGIEDAAGVDGLAYLPFCEAAPSGVAVRFSRPAPAARLGISPTYQSGFISPGANLAWSLTIRNLGDLGPDTFDLETSSSWTAALLAGDGATLLTDTDGDGKVDTGPVGQGGSLTVKVKISAPARAPIGSGDELGLTVTSTRDPAVVRTASFHAAVPARFAQVYRDDADGAMGLLLVQPQGRQAVAATAISWWGYDPAILETSSGNLLSIWERRRFSEGEAIVSELEYLLMDHTGYPLQAVTRLTDHGQATQDVYDEEPVIAEAPDGTLGVSWRRRLLREVAGGVQENWNVYFALLTPSGSLAGGPYNLTGNTGWYGTDPQTYAVPRYWNVRLAATGDGHFVITWQQETLAEPAGACAVNCLLDDIYYAVRDASGGSIRQAARLTQDTPGSSEGYSYPAITGLSGDRLLVAYGHKPGGMAFSVLDSYGNLVRDRSFVGENGWSPAALQLDSGRVILAWTAWTGLVPQVRYVVLDGTSYTLLDAPVVLDVPAAVTGSDFPSLAQDAAGHGILTWMDYGWNDRHNLYYALLGGEGNLLTPPMTFLSTRTPASGSPRIETGFTGHGITSYRQFVDVPGDHWASAAVEQLFDSGLTTGCSALPARYCPAEDVSRAQMAVFLGRAVHGAAYLPPAASGTLFADVPASFWAARWIELFHAEGYTSGCATSPLRYCPNDPLTRAEMAVFLVRAVHGSAFTPAPAVGLFSDVPVAHWAAGWIEQLHRDGLTTGCALSPLRFCPEANLSRAEMAVFLVRAFHLP